MGRGGIHKWKKSLTKELMFDPFVSENFPSRAISAAYCQMWNSKVERRQIKVWKLSVWELRAYKLSLISRKIYCWSYKSWQSKNLEFESLKVESGMFETTKSESQKLDRWKYSFLKMCKPESLTGESMKIKRIRSEVIKVKTLCWHTSIRVPLRHFLLMFCNR